MRVLTALLVLVLVAACGPRLIDTDVTRFTATPSGPAPGTVTILPRPEQRGSLEFQAYAEMVAEQLRQQGFEPVPADAAPRPDYEVRLDWGVGDGVAEVRSSPATVFGGTSIYGGRTGFGVGLGVPLGQPTYVDSRTTYPKWLRVSMRPFGAAEASNVFEGEAIASGTGRSIQPVMPYLVEALFTNFPGRSGVTERVRLPQR